MKNDTIAILRDMTVKAKDLMEPYDYFMTNCAENLAFIKRGKLASDTERIELILEAFAEKGFKQTLKGTQIMCMEVKGTEMLHGMVMAGWGMVTFYYFTKSQLGIAAAMLPGSPEVTLGRINAFESRSKTVLMTSMFGGKTADVEN